MNRFIAANPSKCIGCRTCEIACVLAHNGGRGVETLTPVSFRPRLKMTRTRDISMAVTCHQCEDAPCANACPTGAIVYRQNSVQVEQERCIGCKSCMMACPFGVMEVITLPAMRPFAGVTVAVGVKAEAHKCDLCVDRPGGPACVSVCPTKALEVLDQRDVEQSLRWRRERTAYEAVGEAVSF